MDSGMWDGGEAKRDSNVARVSNRGDSAVPMGRSLGSRSAKLEYL